METNFVDSPPIEVDDMALREIDSVILAATLRYQQVQSKTKDYLSRAEDRLLSGTPGTVYLKKLGHRPLSTTDFENLVNALGSQEDKQALVEYKDAQEALRDRLRTTKAIGLVLEQSDITRDLLYKRAKRPDLWKAEEVIKIMNVLDRLHV